MNQNPTERSLTFGTGPNQLPMRSKTALHMQKGIVMSTHLARTVGHMNAPGGKRYAGVPKGFVGERRTSGEDWRHRAECVDEDPNLHFPVGNTGPALLQIEDAKAVCRRCDVIGSCLSFALTHSLDHGVWGGLDEDERRVLKRRAARERSRMR